MFTFNVAPSLPPGERQTNDLDSFSSSLQVVGIVNDIPCRSHFASLPPESAAVCAAVGCPCSAERALPPPDADGPDVELEFLNLPVRLQSERAKPSSSRTSMFFMFVFYQIL